MRCIVFPLAHIWTLIIISPFTFLYHERHFVFPSKVCVYILYLYSLSFWPGSWSYVSTVIGCNYIFSPPNFFTDFVSDVSSKIRSSSCSITWNWETNLGYQTMLTVVIKQSPTCFKIQGKVFFQYSANFRNTGEAYV